MRVVGLTVMRFCWLGLLGIPALQQVSAGAVEKPTSPQEGGAYSSLVEAEKEHYLIGMVDESVLLSQAPQLIQLQKVESLEVDQKKKEIHEIERKINQCWKQLEEASELGAKFASRRLPQEEYMRQIQALEAQRMELVKQQEEAKLRTARAKKSAIVSWVEEVVTKKGLKADFVLTSGLGLNAQEGTVLYFRKDSKHIVDLTDDVVQLALEKYEVDTEDDIEEADGR